MAFFSGAARKTNMQKMGIPSPCQYNPSLSHSRSFAVAPFGSTTKLNRSVTLNKQGNDLVLRNEDEFASILNMNPKGKPQQQISSVFKSATHRFKKIFQEQPGPGQYEINRKINKSRSLHVFPHHHQPQMKQSVPSIPVDNLGFRENQNNQMTKVKPSQPETTAFHYNPQSSLNPKGVPAWKQSNQISRKEGEKQPGPGDYNYQLKGSKSISSCFASTNDRFGNTKSIKQVKVPGPGSYNTNPNQKNSFNKSNEGYFNSKTTRFQRDALDTVGPGSYFNNTQKKKSRSVAHMKRVPNREEEQIFQMPVKRTTIFETKDKNPGPGQYKNNYGGISYQLHKMLLRKQTTDVMPKEPRKVFENKQAIENPGPGSYQTPIKKTKPPGKLYKKTQVVNLKQEQEPSPSPADYTNSLHTIEQKIKLMNSKLTFTDQKPFNSGTERFKHYAKTNYDNFNEEETETTMPKEAEPQVQNNGDNKRVKRLVMTMIKVRVPFGMSSNKYEQKQSQVYDGPDFYERPKQWIKPSFNIKGKLQ